MTTADEHDRNQLEVLVDDKKAMYVFAEEISDIYRSRWAIELFFKWLKQHVEIKHFYGMTETALQNQIYIALITIVSMYLFARKQIVSSHYSELGAG